MSASRRSFISKAAIAAAMTPLASLSAFGKGLEDAIEKTPKSSAPSDLTIKEVTCAYLRGSLFVKMTTNQDIILGQPPQREKPVKRSPHI
jgi:galactonate dehydratase